MRKASSFFWSASRDPTEIPPRSDSLHTSEWHTLHPGWGSAAYKFFKSKRLAPSPLAQWESPADSQTREKKNDLRVSIALCATALRQTAPANNPEWSVFNLTEVPLIDGIICSLRCASDNRHPAGEPRIRGELFWHPWKVRCTASCLPSTGRGCRPDRARPLTESHPGVRASCPVISLLKWRSGWAEKIRDRASHIHIVSQDGFIWRIFCRQSTVKVAIRILFSPATRASECKPKQSGFVLLASLLYDATNRALCEKSWKYRKLQACTVMVQRWIC